MSAFANPAKLFDPHPETGSATSDGLARAADDVAVAAWTSSPNTLHLAAIRYTDTGPQVGPTCTISQPQVRVSGVVEGRDGEVWVVADDLAQGQSMLLGQVHVSLGTLELTHVWKHRIWTLSVDNGCVPLSWPDQDLLVLVHGNGDSVLGETNVVVVVHMDTGAILDRAAAPVGDGTPSFLGAAALHQASGTLLGLGSRYDVGLGRDRTGMWVAGVSATGTLGPWSFHGDVPTSPTVSEHMRWAAVTAVPDGWNVLYLGAFGAGTTRWMTVTLDGVITEGAVVDLNGNTYYDLGYSKPYDAAYDTGLGRAVACYMSWGTWNGTGYDSGVVHLEADGGGVAYRTQKLPKTTAADYVSTVQVAVVGPGRYVHLVAAARMSPQRSSAPASSFAQFVFTGGENVDPTLVQGGQYDETRRVFRRPISR